MSDPHFTADQVEHARLDVATRMSRRIVGRIDRLIQELQRERAMLTTVAFIVTDTASVEFESQPPGRVELFEEAEHGAALTEAMWAAIEAKRAETASIDRAAVERACVVAAKRNGRDWFATDEAQRERVRATMTAALRAALNEPVTEGEPVVIGEGEVA